MQISYILSYYIFTKLDLRVTFYNRIKYMLNKHFYLLNKLSKALNMYILYTLHPSRSDTSPNKHTFSWRLNVPYEHYVHKYLVVLQYYR